MLKRALTEVPTTPNEDRFLGIIKDPLSQLARRERRLQLVLSTIAMGIWATKLVPNQITALGLTLSQTPGSKTIHSKCGEAANRRVCSWDHVY